MQAPCTGCGEMIISMVTFGLDGVMVTVNHENTPCETFIERIGSLYYPGAPAAANAIRKDVRETIPIIPLCRMTGEELEAHFRKPHA